ncbi:MAG: hypothetical protein ACYSU0_18795, partial [Planctomycetota bacterium]
MDFKTAARAAQARLVRARWLDLLARSAVPVFAAAAAAQAVALVAWGRGCGPAGAAAFVLVWAVACALWAHLRRPDPGSALAAWDERAGRNESFLSAYCFEARTREPQMNADERRLKVSARENPPSICVHPRSSAVAFDVGDGERLHIERARVQLKGCLEKLPRDLPVHLAHRSWIAPLVFVGFVASGVFQRPAAREDLRIEDEAASGARDEGRALSDETKTLGPMKGLDPDERGEVEKLRSNLEGTAEKLQKLSDQTPREVLEELERRAREAEKLAESLGDGEGDILSPGLVAELERHADTADLAAGFRSKDLGKIAEEAEKIAERLRKGVSIEERKRLEDALAKAMRAANARDARSLSGRNLAEAHQNLRQKRLAEAAKRFSKMAKQFSKARQRRLSRRQLQRLANRLR